MLSGIVFTWINACKCRPSPVESREAPPTSSFPGGVNLETGAQLRKAGADVLVAGNYIFGASDPLEACRLLSAL